MVNVDKNTRVEMAGRMQVRIYTIFYSWYNLTTSLNLPIAVPFYNRSSLMYPLLPNAYFINHLICPPFLLAVIVIIVFVDNSLFIRMCSGHSPAHLYNSIYLFVGNYPLSSSYINEQGNTWSCLLFSVYNFYYKSYIIHLEWIFFYIITQPVPS